MKPVDVGEKLKISGSTVRKWSSDYKEFLTASAVAGDGQRRDFVLHDLQVLALVKNRTDHSIRRADIISELRSLKEDDWRNLPPLEDLTRMPEGSEIVPASTAQAVIQAQQALLNREIKSLQDTVQELKDELASERGGRREDVERLMREIAEAQAAQREAEQLVRLYESGRLKPTE